MTSISTRDGRHLDVRVSGPDGGIPLIFHHGTPGAMTPLRVIERAAHAQGLRHVTFSRPGYGGSTRLPGRDVAAVASDVADVLDHLGAERCVVAGWSGGGPHALATAALLPDRVAGVLTMAGAGPYDQPDLDYFAGMGESNVHGFGVALQGEDAMRAHLEKRRPALRDGTPSGVGAALRPSLPPVDEELLTDEFTEDVSASFREGLRNGVDGWLDDDLAFVTSWGFPVEAITVPAFVWQGSEDMFTPFAHGQWLATHVPGAVPHLEKGEGHLSITVGAAERMLTELAGTL
jgi:pimeloyl-ACP methyl ester carboxylesterase